jgi:hypothetical protein
MEGAARNSAKGVGDGYGWEGIVGNVKGAEGNEGGLSIWNSTEMANDTL